VKDQPAKSEPAKDAKSAIPEEWKRPQWAEQSQETKDHIMDFALSQMAFPGLGSKTFLEMAKSDDFMHADVYILSIVIRLCTPGLEPGNMMFGVTDANAMDEARVKASKRPEDVMAWAFRERIWKIWEECKKGRDVTVGHTKLPPVRGIYIGGAGHGFVLY
jgi:hypothetical protein